MNYREAIKKTLETELFINYDPNSNTMEFTTIEPFAFLGIVQSLALLHVNHACTILEKETFPTFSSRGYEGGSSSGPKVSDIKELLEGSNRGLADAIFNDNMLNFMAWLLNQQIPEATEEDTDLCIWWSPRNIRNKWNEYSKLQQTGDMPDRSIDFDEVHIFMDSEAVEERHTLPDEITMTNFVGILAPTGTSFEGRNYIAIKNIEGNMMAFINKHIGSRQKTHRSIVPDKQQQQVLNLLNNLCVRTGMQNELFIGGDVNDEAELYLKEDGVVYKVKTNNPFA